MRRCRRRSTGDPRRHTIEIDVPELARVVEAARQGINPVSTRRFADRFSTCQQATTASGRGVGMARLRDAEAALGGVLEPNFKAASSVQAPALKSPVGCQRSR